MSQKPHRVLMKVVRYLLPLKRGQNTFTSHLNKILKNCTKSNGSKFETKHGVKRNTSKQCTKHSSKQSFVSWCLSEVHGLFWALFHICLCYAYVISLVISSLSSIQRSFILYLLPSVKTIEFPGLVGLHRNKYLQWKQEMLVFLNYKV